jgi:selenium-binding protein 1
MSQTLDPTFYRSPAEAMAAPAERLAYVAAYDPAGTAKDAMVVLVQVRVQVHAVLRSERC